MAELTGEQRHRAAGVLLTMAAGDALGAGYEFGGPYPADMPVADSASGVSAVHLEAAFERLHMRTGHTAGNGSLMRTAYRICRTASSWPQVVSAVSTGESVRAARARHSRSANDRPSRGRQR